LQSADHALVDPLALRYTLRLCDAIERFVAAGLAHDRARFRVGEAELRYVVERHLYFALVGDHDLYGYFTSKEQNRRPPNEALSGVGRLVAPYFSTQPQVSSGGSVSFWRRFLRSRYRRLGQSTVRCEGASGPPKVLFLVIHPKFVRFLLPISDALPIASAFLTIEDPQMFQWLEARQLPRVGIDLTSEAREQTRPSVKVSGFDYSAGPFDYLAIRFNSIRQALTTLAADCVVVPEGNAPIYELVSRVAKTLRIPTLCVQQGWSPIPHSGFRNMTYSRMCVWGQGFVDLLARDNPGTQFVATGNHALTSTRQEDDRNRNAIAFFLQKAHLITDKASNGMLRLISWSAHQFPDKEIRVREHPSAPLTAAELATFDALPNVRLVSAEEVTLDDALAGCRVAVAMYSTTILEAAATGAVPLILNVAGFEHYHPNIAADGAAVEAEDFAAARSALSRLVLDDEYLFSFGDALDRVRQRFFARNRNEALAAIVSEIEALRRERRAGKPLLSAKRRRR
jgi:hypothetical protein